MIKRENVIRWTLDLDEPVRVRTQTGDESELVQQIVIEYRGGPPAVIHCKARDVRGFPCPWARPDDLMKHAIALTRRWREVRIAQTFEAFWADVMRCDVRERIPG